MEKLSFIELLKLYEYFNLIRIGGGCDSSKKVHARNICQLIEDRLDKLTKEELEQLMP